MPLPKAFSMNLDRAPKRDNSENGNSESNSEAGNVPVEPNHHHFPKGIKLGFKRSKSKKLTQDNEKSNQLNDLPSLFEDSENSQEDALPKFFKAAQIKRKESVMSKNTQQPRNLNDSGKSDGGDAYGAVITIHNAPNAAGVPFSQALRMCTDPTCNVCPPECHRPKYVVPKRAERRRAPFRRLEEELEALDSDDDNRKGLRDMLDNFQRSLSFHKIHNWWSDFKEDFLSFINPSLTVFNPHCLFVKNWNRFFVVACLLAFCVDPLFFFINYIEKSTFCVRTSWGYVLFLTIIRSITDFCYFLNILLQFRLAYVETEKNFWWFLPQYRSKAKAGELVMNSKDIALTYLTTGFFFDFLAVLPLPQVMMYAVIPNSDPSKFSSTVIRISVLLQFIPRCVRFVPILSGRADPTGLLFESAWASFLLNLFMYIMASHVVGSIWYQLALERTALCLKKLCTTTSLWPNCNSNFLLCPHGTHRFSGVRYQDHLNGTIAAMSDIASNCMDKETSFFDYGLFQNGVSLTLQTKIVDKYLYGFSWGFLNISTLAGNQVPSEWVVEIIFTTLICALGLFLFAVLIGNIQNFLQALSRRTFEYQLHLYDVEHWMNRRNFPPELKSKVMNLERLLWVTKKGLDEEQLIESFTEDLRLEVRRHIALDLVRKSVLFKSMGSNVLDAICDRLRHRIFTSETYLLREGFPVQRMFFVLRGSMSSATTNRGQTGFVNEVILSTGDFLGEELLIAYLEVYGKNIHQTVRGAKSSSSSRGLGRRLSSFQNDDSESLDILPSSLRTFRCLGPVEGFALEASDIEFVCKQFRKEMHSPSVQHALNLCSLNRQTYAAITIQCMFRYYMRKKLGITLPSMVKAVAERRYGKLVKAAAEHYKQTRQLF